MEMKTENNVEVSEENCTVKMGEEGLALDSDGSSNTSVSSSGTRTKDRGLWANKLEFFLAITGYTVGLGSIWRFPIICRYTLLYT